LIIDNADRLAEDRIQLLNAIQETAKDAADDRIATVVLVSNGYRVPYHMTGKFILFVVLLVNHDVLIHCYREKLVV
jgi:hypothetical protein